MEAKASAAGEGAWAEGAGPVAGAVDGIPESVGLNELEADETGEVPVG